MPRGECCCIKFWRFQQYGLVNVLVRQASCWVRQNYLLTIVTLETLYSSVAIKWLIDSKTYFLGKLSVGFPKKQYTLSYFCILAKSGCSLDWCISSIPLSAILASNGLTTPPCGVPCSGNPGLTPDFRQRNIPVLMPLGAMCRSIMLARAYPVEAFFDIELDNSFFYSVATRA